MRSELEHAIKHKSATLEKYVTPVPTVILDDIVGLSLDPQVKPNQGYSSEPPMETLIHDIYARRDRSTLPRAFQATGLRGHGSKQMRTCSKTGSHLNVHPVSPKMTQEVRQRT